jgi:hypothetical protein
MQESAWIWLSKSPSEAVVFIRNMFNPSTKEFALIAMKAAL